ncbi:2-octaprenyl-6-methoxyphenyl hydroxylase [Thalassotalea crassostreae]|uniref:2-octaprenyl-6-methoxyphenyl hydroxylase n=1 Tax=Thalassotalea crassostreae TaxID=1763536 RepID=UPI000839A9BC|nr:2-octaprenyl-6-methoxyphenyl hydroxylase [Thalassotalea crassostreae]
MFDVIISGAGLAGASMALALAKLQKKDGTPLSIAVVEAFAIRDDLALNYDARVIALSHGSACYLKQLGCWQQLKDDAMAIKTIHISDRGHYGKARINAEDFDIQGLGYVAEIQAIGNALISTLKQFDNVTFFAPQTIDHIQWHKQYVEVTLESGETLSAPLLLGCDGGQSKCRELAKIECDYSDYQQCAIIANVSTEQAHQNKAFERFSDSGPIALLPMTDNRSSLVWTVKPEQVAHLLALSDEDFAAELEQEFGAWLGGFSNIGKRFSFPLKLIKANDQVAHRMALIGNASHTLHPIAGQGFNLGMRDVQVFAELFEQTLQSGNDLGDFHNLQNYAKLRAQDHQQVIALTDSLVHLFSNQHIPLVVGRNIGLKVLNYIPSLKAAFAGKTMGHFD